MCAVDLAETARKHDGLDPLAALTAGQPLPERTRVACDQRLPKLVAIV